MTSEAAYIEARFKPQQYVITAKELEELGRRVQKLRAAIVAQCEQRIAKLQQDLYQPTTRGVKQTPKA